MEEKVTQIIGECFDKLRTLFDENGVGLSYEFEDYVIDMILINLKESIRKIPNELQTK